MNTLQKPGDKSGKQKVILLVLALVALATVFVLPNLVSGPWITDNSESESSRPAPTASDVSPSTAAEKTRYRQESQSVLAQIIATRDRLEIMNVGVWADAEFSQASQYIETGDQLYSYGEYKESLGSYGRALEQFTELEAMGNQKLDESLEAGFQAIEDMNPVIAAASSELASAIAAQDPRVRDLAARLETLPVLIGHMDDGDESRLAGDPVSAQAAYQRAVDTDRKHKGAAESLAAIRTAIIDNRFRGHMSRAYAALESGDFESARAAFADAESVYPGNAAVAEGLAQVENRNSRIQVGQQINRAAELERDEEWAQAVSIYESLLAQDGSLADVRVKLIPARVRADLDRRLRDATDDPLGLSSRAAHQRGQALLSDASGIPNPGAKLSGQIVKLERMLRLALSPVDVVFQSDNLTNVTLFRVAELGRFQQTSLTLRPGRYIAAGTRQGFRDVRIEFTVTGEPLDGPIVVQCQEPV